MVNGPVPLVSLPDFSLLVYKSARCFCVLILYPANLLYSLSISSNFLVTSLGISVNSIMESANTERFTSLFPIWIPFISLSSLIAVARTSKSMLNNSSKGCHPCLIPDLKGDAFSFSPLRVIFLVGLLYHPLMIETPQKVGIEGTCLNIRAIYDKLLIFYLFYSFLSGFPCINPSSLVLFPVFRIFFFLFILHTQYR